MNLRRGAWFLAVLVVVFPLPVRPQSQPGSPGIFRSPFGWGKVKLYTVLGGGKVPPGPYQPLSGEERKELYFRDTFLSSGAVARPLFLAGWKQLWNSPPEWDGAKGYSQRAGTRFLVYTVQYSVEHPLDAALKYEPRYLPCRCSGFFRRFGHSIAFSFLTVNSKGRMAPNIGPYAGGYAGELAVEKLYPGGYDVWRAMRRGNGKLYFGWIFNSLREFSPEIKRALGGR